jgi:hypothetical protein
MGNMAAYFATKKAKERAAITLPVMPSSLPDIPMSEVMVLYAEPDAALNGDPCPHCGKALASRGRHFHIRSCHVP